MTYNKDIIVELIGGEPTLAKGLLDFSDKISDYYPHIQVMLFSNFSKDVKFFENLQDNNIELFLAWHSTEKDRRNKDFINKLRYLKTNCTVYVMFENRYVDESLYAYNEIKKLNIEKTYLCNLTYDYMTKLICSLNEKYTDEDIKLFNSIKLAESSNETTIYNIKNNLVLILENNTTKTIAADNIINRNFKHYICDAGKNYLFVNSDGNIFPCRNYMNSKNIGNIYSVKLPTLKQTLCQFDSCCTIVKAAKTKVFKK